LAGKSSRVPPIRRGDLNEKAITRINVYKYPNRCRIRDTRRDCRAGRKSFSGTFQGRIEPRDRFTLMRFNARLIANSRHQSGRYRRVLIIKLHYALGFNRGLNCQP